MEIAEKLINFKVKVEYDDLRALRKSISRSRTRLGVIFYLILFITILGFSFAFGGSVTPVTQTDAIDKQIATNSVPLYISMLPTIGFIFMVGFIIYILITRKRNIKQQYESNKQIQKEFEYTFSDMGIEAHSESVNFKYSWDEVYKVTETKSIFAIYESNSTVLIIPKRCIADELKIQELKVLFVSKMLPKKYKIINC